MLSPLFHLDAKPSANSSSSFHGLLATRILSSSSLLLARSSRPRSSMSQMDVPVEPELFALTPSRTPRLLSLSSPDTSTVDARSASASSSTRPQEVAMPWRPSQLAPVVLPRIRSCKKRSNQTYMALFSRLIYRLRRPWILFYQTGILRCFSILGASGTGR